MILQSIGQITRLILFFVPGTLLCYLLFQKTDLVKRTAYSILLSVSMAGLLGTLLYYLGAFDQLYMVIVLLAFSAIFILVLILQNRRSARWCERYATLWNKDILYIILFSIVGSIWKLWFFWSTPNAIDPYGYAFDFVGKTVPNLGFYTGMAADRAGYIGLNVLNGIQTMFLTHQSLVLGSFLITFLFLCLIYAVFMEYRGDRTLALIGVAVMSLGPIELFHAMATFGGHPLSYLCLIPLFIFFRSKEKNVFWVCFLLALLMMFTYYTASVTIILASCGFVAALLVKKAYHRPFDRDKLMGFICIILVVAGYLYAGTSLWSYSSGRLADDSGMQVSLHAAVSVTADTLYKNPTTLGLSAIRWQMLFFFVCGLTFIVYLMFLLVRKRYAGSFSERHIDLLLCLIPVVLVSAAFFYVGLPARIFDYFAFFGLMALTIPRRYYGAFFICAWAFIVVTGFQVTKDTRIFYQLSPLETQGAIWVSQHLTGKVFTDIVFADQLISHGDYDVTGAKDDDVLVQDLFYQHDTTVFLYAVRELDADGVSYIAITKRMTDSYVLMVDYPQRAIETESLYASNLHKVYDNGDVEIYSTALP